MDTENGFEVKLGKMEKLEVSIPHYKVTTKDVDNIMEDIQRHYIKVIEKSEEPGIIGDTVTIDFIGSIEGNPFPGGAGEDLQLELGSRTFIPGFEEKLIGVKTGKTINIEVVFPTDYDKNLAGKKAVFTVIVKKIECKELRDLDDKFAQEFLKYDCIDEFRNHMRDDMEKTKQEHKQEVIRKEVLKKAMEQCEIELPSMVIENYVEYYSRLLINKFEETNQISGLNLEEFLQMTGSDKETFRAEMLPYAEKNAKIDFMLEELLEENGFEVSEDEVNDQIHKMALKMDVNFEQAKMHMEPVMEGVVHRAKIYKTIQYLLDNAIIKEHEEYDETNEKENIAS